jgi:hypothetical protein
MMYEETPTDHRPNLRRIYDHEGIEKTEHCARLIETDIPEIIHHACTN